MYNENTEIVTWSTDSKTIGWETLAKNLLSRNWRVVGKTRLWSATGVDRKRPSRDRKTKLNLCSVRVLAAYNISPNITFIFFIYNIVYYIIAIYTDHHEHTTTLRQQRLSAWKCSAATRWPAISTAESAAAGLARFWPWQSRSTPETRAQVRQEREKKN